MTFFAENDSCTKSPFSRSKKRVAAGVALVLVLLGGVAGFVMLYDIIGQQEWEQERNRLANRIPEGMLEVPACVDGESVVQYFGWLSGDKYLVHTTAWPSELQGDPCLLKPGQIAPSIAEQYEMMLNAKRYATNRT